MNQWLTTKRCFIQSKEGAQLLESTSKSIAEFAVYFEKRNAGCGPSKLFIIDRPSGTLIKLCLPDDLEEALFATLEMNGWPTDSVKGERKAIEAVDCKSPFFVDEAIARLLVGLSFFDRDGE